MTNQFKKQNIKIIESYFHIPVGYLKHADCEQDMSPYAAAIVRLFTSKKIKRLIVKKKYFKKSMSVKSFKISAIFKNLKYYGSFSRDSEYRSQILFSNNNRVIESPNRIFALPYENLEVILRSKKKKYQKIKIKKDDQINNFFKIIIRSLKLKKFNFFYKILLEDAKFRDRINRF